MTSTANRQRKVKMPIDIKKKFAAAICMLLIAAIMMISSTYAWFTLSTAPEVTGITTNVGANGNLEIALLNERSFESSLDDLGIQSGVGDSMEVKNVTEANETWGNLVDLSDASYGLDNVILNPAALNLKPFEDDNTNANKLIGNSLQGGLTSPLLAPNYGADGRVINVQKTTTTGIFQDGKFEETLTGAGVRAIGVSSGITLRVSAYRTALSQITVKMNSAKAAAQRSLVDNGQTLASLLVTAVADPSYELTAEDAAAFAAVKEALTASLASVSDAIRQAALAKYLSAAGAGDLTDAEVAEAVESFGSAALSNLATLAGDVDISFLDTAIAAVAAAQTKIDSVTVTEGQAYSAMATQVAKLIDRDYTEINGYDGSTLSSEDFGTLATAILGAGQVEVTMKDGSGIYADIAKLVGNYTASGLYITVEYQGISVDNMPTMMNTNVTGTAMLVAAATAATGGDPVSAGGSTAVDDTYGYFIDLGVRTNAANSSLLLQQAASQRIYSDSEAALTQGGGTYVTFTTSDRRVFSQDDVTALMSAVRVVFVTPNASRDGYEILAVAAPNVKVTVNGSGVRQLVAADSRFEQELTAADSDVDYSTTVSAKLFLFDLADIGVEEIVPNAEYITTLGNIKTTGEDEDIEPDFTIASLQQNKAKKISALVYLDGDIVDNTMVANAATTMSGKINFQFASSAELIPMEVTGVRENGSENQSNNPAEPAITKEALASGIATIKASDIYTTAQSADPATAEQTALLTAVASAETIAAKDAPTESELTTAAASLGAAYVAAGGTNPFSA